MSIQEESPQIANNDTENESPEESAPQSFNENSALGIRDKLFLYASGTEILLGLLLIYLPTIPLIPIVPSILIGSGIATFVYRFMGGIKQNDTLVMGGMKIGGALASLLISAIVVNKFLEEQVKETQITFEPAQGDVLVLRKSDGELVNLEVEIKNRRIKYKIDKDSTVLSDNFDRLSKIKTRCFDGEGICTEEWKRVQFTIDDALKPNQATMCEKYARVLDQIPIQLAPPPKKDGEIINPVLVSITNEVKAPCAKQQSQNNQPTVIFISPKTAKHLGTQLRAGQTTEGTAKIAPLRGILFDYPSVSRGKTSRIAQRLTSLSNLE